jgi:hypothetical protein
MGKVSSVYTPENSQPVHDVFSRVSGRSLKGGYIVVIQTHGRNGQYNPHLHCIATSGGWDQQAKQ